jgi:thioredoxin reductase (NADPH)
MAKFYRLIYCAISFANFILTAQALPQRYQVLSREPIRNFSFIEDQPWLQTPTKHTLDDFRGKGHVIILHLWSTACPSCVQELPQLDRFAQLYTNKAVEIIALSVDDPQSGSLRNYLTRHNIHALTPYHRPSLTRPVIRGLPTTFFLNKAGQLVGKIEGPALWDSEELAGLVKRLMEEEIQQEENIFNQIKAWFGALLSGIFIANANAKELKEPSMSLPTPAHHIKVAIIGSGPAGYTAAIYTARANLNPVMFVGLQPGGQLTITTDVENYPGFAQTIQGPWLMEQMKAQADHVGTRMVASMITDVDFSKRPFTLTTDQGETYTADTVIIATGAQAKWLGLESEKKFMGFGVSGCATCDGFFYKDQEVAVIGGGNTAVEEALFLTNFAKKVTLIHRRDQLRAEKMLQDRALNHEKITIVWDHALEEVLGTEKPKSVTGIRVRNTKTNQPSELAVTGVFIAIGHKPATQIFAGKLAMDAEGYLLCPAGTTKTNIEGVYAAGDVQDKHYRQAITAAGQGCMAALDAERFLAMQEGQKKAS